MPSITRSGFLLLLIGLILALTVGCGRSLPTPEPVTLTFAHDRADSAHYQRLARQFSEQTPHITIDLRPRDWDILAGLPLEDDDVFVTSQFALTWLLQNGRILDLSAFAEQDATVDLEDFYPGALDLFRSEGKLWAVPARVDLMLLYYNQDLFDQTGVPYPAAGWTWDDFLATALALRDPNADVYGYLPNYAPDLVLFDPFLFIHQHGGRIFDDLQQPTRTTFDDPLTIEALEWYVNLLYLHDVAPSPEQARRLYVDYPRMYSAVLQSQVGMWLGMLSERGGATWPAAWEMRWGAVPLPRDRASFTLALMEGYFISAQTAHADEAWQWLAYLSGQMPTRRAPVRISQVESDAFAQTVGDQTADAVRASLASMTLLSPKLAEFEGALGLFAVAYDALLNRRATPEEAMTRAQQQAR